MINQKFFYKQNNLLQTVTHFEVGQVRTSCYINIDLDEI